ncbi:DUF3300 domain-containing protein [Rhizobium leguminosarum bv. viciae 248]|uniref:DUF3300 domain-containing protein n=1 Tax=Rhizobium leguminosarum TaxID=384 RepID=UPI00035E26C9|nr:DUF3300 domain-containing protein [Rhizobium leguminosarum]MCA2408819.1 DUF3300 domain-containing protein [Rhizobium leguminosarum]NKL05579.1 DUF3300 domain-containing protein [Rhizobium leguminosarum bv. viciae]NKL82125.1 DUF3300 domain-containing protein [Rhizobium leguminosarum bv. viciae]NKL91641.1 DUF3300 domain-containing protein [Rhizobium leguminosarum bv. viciae]NKM65634.1 DUF3300 domain-containing protein [Rhizobium leguminosarum bv. viciae]
MARPYALLLATGLFLPFAGFPFSPHVTPPAAAQEPAASSPVAADDDAPAPLSDDELEILVARIALYPDELVALVTSASLYPLQVVEAARFLDTLKKQPGLKPKTTWDGSIVSLLNYPQIVTMMSEDLDWTQSLGEALSYQQKDVLIAIQQLRDKAVADGIIKTDDKIKVSQENDNVVIVSASPEKIYVPQYAPEMLYEPNYAAEPIGYYSEPYPNYYYPTATFFAGVVTGAVWAAAVDWNRWGVWGGRWNGNVDIDCNNCLNNINGKVNINDVDWKNVDRSKIGFDGAQFNNIDRNSFRSSIEANAGNRVGARGNDRANTIRNQPGKISVNDVRKSKIDADRINAARNKAGNTGAAAGGGKAAQAAQNRRPDARTANRTGEKARSGGNAKRPVAKPKPAARVDNRPRKPSALGQVDSGRRAEMQSNRGRQAMAGSNRGGGREMRGGGRGGGGGGRGGGGGGRGGGRR